MSKVRLDAINNGVRRNHIEFSGYPPGTRRIVRLSAEKALRSNHAPLAVFG